MLAFAFAFGDTRGTERTGVGYGSGHG